MLRLAWCVVPLASTLACATTPPPPAAQCVEATRTATAAASAAATAAATPAAASPEVPVDIAPIRATLVAKHGAAHAATIERGLRQVAALWRPGDGDQAALAAFAEQYYLADEAQRTATFVRLQEVFEQIDGHANEVGRELRRATDLDLGPLLPLDSMLAGFDPGAHLGEDLFTSKIAFVVLLNFPLTTLEERMTQGQSWSRRQWAEARLAGRFSSRVPAEVRQASAKAGADADLYIAEYNVWMHHVLDPTGARLFPKGMRLISHWNLRDELKANYALGAAGLAKQQVIVKVMERIVTQTIPRAAIDNPKVDWDPFTNTLKAAPADTIEPEAPAAKAVVLDTAPEPDARYAQLQTQWKAARLADPYYPAEPSAIRRSFERGQELPEQRVRELLTAVLSSPEVPKVAALIEQRLGRKLGPQDLWYAGFKASPGKTEAELDAITRKKYPSAEAFKKDMPRILQGLGFAPGRAKYLADRIAVDPSRGAGHAMPALRKGDFPRLRTRIEKDGMNYKGYNIAIHELGHNVEQVFSLYDVDHFLLSGVPNNAFTEALAFVFQARDLELLGLVKKNEEADRMRVLGDFWATWEIAGVALVDADVWHWMYEHPTATPAELRAATVAIAQKYWNQYYAPVLGAADSPLLGIYSHMIAYPLYLSNYPLGHLIAFQIEEHIDKTGKLGVEFERMSRIGSVVPDAWMTVATGSPVSAEPLLRATKKSLGQ